MTTQVSIDRTSLSLSALVIGSAYNATGIWLDPDGLIRPAKTWSRNYATARDWNGAVQTDARLEQSAYALTVYLSGSSTANVETLYTTLETALYQFTFTMTVTVDGTARVWTADCADVTPAPYTFGMVGNFLQLVAVTIPVYPISA